jgi:nicotinate-nucleotide pyrophosphorylase (carboxylating)
MFSPEEQRACRRLVDLALAEDLGERGDVTSRAVIPDDLQGSAVFLAKAAGVIAGLPAAELVMNTVDSQIRFDPLKRDGERLVPGDRLAILAGERTALNFLQHLSGVASLTRRYVDALSGCAAKIFDTRKTLPGWRLLEKYAVRCGGGHKHRMGLDDGILIKDNHLAALHAAPDPLAAAILAAQKQHPDLAVEVEVDSLAQLAPALVCRPAIVLLDNMSLEQLREAVRMRNAQAPSVLLEASGGVTLQSVRVIAETGVDRISVGALTHSAAALDIALDHSP